MRSDANNTARGARCFYDPPPSKLGGFTMVTLAIDWSGAKKLTRKLALAEVINGQLQPVMTLRSREEAASEIIRRCQETSDTIVGLDFAFSMPEWFLTDRGLSTPFEFWRLVEREGERWLRDCSPPFWGRTGKCRPQLKTHYRRTEELVGRIGGISPKSTFQVGGAGSVGTGSIRGMPILLRIREAGISIWPFDPASPPFVVEIYPRLLTGSVNKRSLAARSDYLEQYWGALPLPLRRDIARSEDSFDASVSALMMDRHRRELEHLSGSDETAQWLEGAIWSPRAETPIIH